jgi:tetratricopeptide (TPR) repeat protein
MKRLWRFVYIAAAAGLLAGSLAFLSCGQKQDGVSVDERTKLAGALADNKLYSAAIEEYRSILARPDIDDKQRGNISFLIARVFFDDLKDYENAAAYYVRAREYDSTGSYMDELSQNLVACLEKMGHLVDAKRELNESTNLTPAPRAAGDVEVARIGKTPIWLSEIDRQIQSLPARVQQQLLTPEAKRQFVHQYVGVELMYQAALREGYDRDPEIQRRKEIAFKNLLVDKYVVDKVMPAVKIDTSDVRNFYAANKESRYKNAPYDSVKAQVFLDYQGQKTEAAYSDYIARLAQSEQIEFLDQNIK